MTETAEERDTVSTERKDRYHHGNLRAALLEAARLELEETGLDSFSLRKVARRAGVSHAAPAHHFGDVSGLLTALAAEGYRRFVRAMEAGQARMGPGPRAQLQGAGLGYAEFAVTEPALFRLIHGSDLTNYADTELSAAAEAAFRHLVRLTVALTGRAEDDPETEREVAAIWAMAHGASDLVRTGRLKAVSALDGPARERAMLDLLDRVIPAQGT
jgi:AcrR family transcriptional regulator